MILMTAITQNKNEKLEIFIDLMNVESAVDRGTVDYACLVKCLAKGRQVTVIRAYDQVLGCNPEQKRLHEDLKREKVRVIIPRGRCANQTKQIGVDVQLATDVVTSAIRSSCDTILIVSGDGDFIPVIDSVKAAGKKVEFAAFSEYANMSLIDETDYFTYLDDLPLCREVEA